MEEEKKKVSNEYHTEINKEVRTNLKGKEASNVCWEIVFAKGTNDNLVYYLFI